MVLIILPPFFSFFQAGELLGGHSISLLHTYIMAVIITLVLELVSFPTALARFALIKKKKRICWFKRKYHSEINLGYIWVIRKQRTMTDVEVTRMFHSSFPSSFNFSLVAPVRNGAWRLEQQQAWKFFITCPSDRVAQQPPYLHLPSCGLLLSCPGDILSPDVPYLPPCMVL